MLFWQNNGIPQGTSWKETQIYVDTSYLFTIKKLQRIIKKWFASDVIWRRGRIRQKEWRRIGLNIQIKIVINLKIKQQITIPRKNLITGEMETKTTCLPNRRTMMLKLMWSQLENMTKSKVIKKYNNLPVQK